MANKRAVSVIGTGDFGRALAVRLKGGGYDVHFGSQDPSSRREFMEAVSPALKGLSMLTIGEALAKSEVIFFAIDVKHYSTLRPFTDLLNDKIIVDVSNPGSSSKDYSAAEKLQEMFPRAHVCKAFNTLSAYTLGDNCAAQTGNRVVYVSANSLQVRALIKEIAVDMGLQAVEMGSLCSARDLEHRQQTLCLGWGWATVVTGVWLTLWLVYVTCFNYVIKKDIDYSTPTTWPLERFNVICCAMAVNQLALCYLPGCLAAFLQIIRGTKYRAFPRWLDLWLKMRKQLGLYGLMFAAMHGCISLMLFGPVYYPHNYKKNQIDAEGDATPFGSLMKDRIEASYHLAVWAMVLYIVLGISSLPSVASVLNWREWRLVQTFMGLACLALACAHACTLKYKLFQKAGTFAGVIQLPDMNMQLVAFLVLLCRLVLWMPCVNSYLRRIRRGHVRGASADEEQKVEAPNGHCMDQPCSHGPGQAMVKICTSDSKL